MLRRLRTRPRVAARTLIVSPLCSYVKTTDKILYLKEFLSKSGPNSEFYPAVMAGSIDEPAL
jgi:hypothetical protein